MSEQEAYNNLILERDKTIWIATIETPTGDIVEQYQDLIKEDDPEYSDWDNLGAFLLQVNLMVEGANLTRNKSLPPYRIINLRARFRSHTERLPDNADGYYFKNGVICDIGTDGQNTANCYVLGHVANGELHKVWMRVPELIEHMRETVPVPMGDPMLILNWKQYAQSIKEKKNAKQHTNGEV